MGRIPTDVTTFPLRSTPLAVLIIFLEVGRLVTRVASRVTAPAGIWSAPAPVAVVDLGGIVLLLLSLPFAASPRKSLSDSATTIASSTSTLDVFAAPAWPNFEGHQGNRIASPHSLS